MPDQVFQSMATREGSVEKVPVNSNDITNKNYVDNLIVTLTVGTLLVTSIVIGGLIKLSEVEGVLFVNASSMINGSLNVTQNITADTYFGDGSQLTGIPSDVNDTDVGINNLIVSGNTTTKDFTMGDISALTYIQLDTHVVLADLIEYPKLVPHANVIFTDTKEMYVQGKMNYLTVSATNDATGSLFLDVTDANNFWSVLYDVSDTRFRILGAGSATNISLEKNTIIIGTLKVDSNIFTSGITATGNITAENVFLPQYIYAHTNETIPVLGASTWTNVTISQEDSDVKQGITHDAVTLNHTFTINATGVYDLDYNFDVEDTSVGSSDIDVAARVIYANGTELLGSVFETDITKRGVETELSHNFLAEMFGGETIIFQFIADNENVQISTHGTFGDHPESATVRIIKIANLP